MESIEERFLDILSDEGIDFILGLPCDRMKTLFSRFYEMPNYIPIAREEEGVGISAGISLGGKRPAMFVQSSGIGNMINALLSLTNFYKLPLPIFISHRGIYKEGIAAQIPMGKALKHILRGAGIGYTIISNEHHLSRIRSKLKTVFKRELIHAFLISPSLWEASTESVSPKRHRRRSSDLDTNFPFHIKKRAYYRRFDILKIISRYIRGRVVVSNLGVPSKELYRVCPQDTNFYMLGSMGMASPVGLGLSLSTNREVFVIDGDGSLLMSPQILSTIGNLSPPNLKIICIDNGSYGSTGNQPTHTYKNTDLSIVARGFGIKNVFKVSTRREIEGAFLKKTNGPAFIHIIALPGNEPVPNIPLSAEEIKTTFMKSLQD